MPKVFLISAAAVIGFSVTIERPVRPEVGVHSDFEPAWQVEMVLNSSVDALAARMTDTL